MCDKAGYKALVLPCQPELPWRVQKLKYFSFYQKSSTPPLSEGRKEECVFPDLIECTTPVEQILPSLATSRFSRGLGHVVHAQNIRTVGNLSALTEDQVQKLPIRSPKVSTLRRVLRNFHENRAPKNPKVNQLRGKFSD
jgi:hypothetical protein